jgi:hypothetical protein
MSFWVSVHNPSHSSWPAGQMGMHFPPEHVWPVGQERGGWVQLRETCWVVGWHEPAEQEYVVNVPVWVPVPAHTSATLHGPQA